MSQILARANALEWERVREQGHASEGRQAPRYVWAAYELKPALTEPEWAAACRAVKDCAAATGVHPRDVSDAKVDQCSSDYGAAAKIAACQVLFGLRSAALARTGASRAPHCVEWIASMWPLKDIARELGHWRKMGAGRERIPDLRPTRPFVRLVLMGMADYYDACDAEVTRWRAM